MDATLSISGLLNRVLFGARIARDEDVNSQGGTIIVAYVANLILIFLIIAAAFAITGLYDPFHASFAASNIKLPLAFSNALTFILTYFASLSWVENDAAVERRRNASRPTGWFYKLLSFLSVPAIVGCGVLAVFLLLALFHSFGWTNLFASVVVNALFLHVLFTRRNQRTPNSEQFK